MKTDTGRQPRPQVGVSLMVVFDGSVLLGRRKGTHGAGEYGTPGGRLENGESLPECALRELREECGPDVIVTKPQFLCVTNLRTYMPCHWVDIAMMCWWVDGHPRTMEPDKCGGWDFFPLSALPGPRFGALDNMVTAFFHGRPAFES